MTKSNGSQIFNFGRLNIQTKLIGSMIPLVLMVVAVLIFMRSAATQLDQAVKLSEKARMAQEVDTYFQLAVGKGKDVAILRDEKHKAMTTDYLQKAQEAFQRLSAKATTSEEEPMVQKIGDSISSVGAKLTTLVSTANEKDTAQDLYTQYLKDITIEFDNASREYISFVNQKAKEAQDGVVAQMASGKQNGGWLVVA